MRTSYIPLVRAFVVRVWQPHPVAVAYARELGDIYGRGIDGGRGTIIANSSADSGFMGYAAPPQLFTGWNPAYQSQVGTPLVTPGGLPGTSVPGGSGPLDSAMAQIMAGTSS
jgi:hypothetical protein